MHARLADRLQAALDRLFAGLSLGQLGRYVAISALALALDLSVFLALLAVGGAAVPASVAGYLAGTQLHWVLSTRMVFAAGLGEAAAERKRQQVLYFASAAVGIACNAGIVHASERIGAPLLLGKLAAIGASFVVVLAVRAGIVFARKGA